MKKSVFTKMSFYFCSAMLITNLVCAEDSGERGDRVPVGTRTSSKEEQIPASQALAQNREKQAMPQGKLGKSGEALVAQGQSGDTASEEESSRVTNNAMFFTSHPGAFQRIYNIGVFGDTVELEDGSVWLVRQCDAYKTLNWLPSDLMVISPNTSWFSPCNYRLTNQNIGVSVEVNLTLGPIYNATLTHWIIGIDYYNDVVYLEDGTVWEMSRFDRGIVRQWLVNDTVIIGINDGYFSSTSPNVLINVNTPEINYARGTVVY